MEGVLEELEELWEAFCGFNFSKDFGNIFKDWGWGMGLEEF